MELCGSKCGLWTAVSEMGFPFQVAFRWNGIKLSTNLGQKLLRLLTNEALRKLRRAARPGRPCTPRSTPRFRCSLQCVFRRDFLPGLVHVVHVKRTVQLCEECTRSGATAFLTVNVMRGQENVITSQH